MDRRLREAIKGDTTADAVHTALMELAAERANQDPELPWEVFPAGGGRDYPFWPTPEHSAKGGLCISWDTFALTGMKEPELSELRSLMQGIGRKAVRAVITEHISTIIGISIGEARKGRDYFARFR